MQLFTIFELILTGVGTLYLLKRYPAKDVSLLVKVVCFISWFLSFATLILLPLDVYYVALVSFYRVNSISIIDFKGISWWYSSYQYPKRNATYTWRIFYGNDYNLASCILDQFFLHLVNYFYAEVSNNLLSQGFITFSSRICGCRRIHS